MKEKQFEKEKTVCKEKVSYTKITDHSSRHFTKIYVTQITELLRFEIDGKKEVFKFAHFFSI